MPSHVDEHVGLFDRFAGAVARVTARAPFFAASVAMVLIWAPTYRLWSTGDLYHLMINTPTTILTWLLVALQANTQARADAAVQKKLNAIADALADLMEHGPGGDRLDHDVAELRSAVGLEDRESA